MEIIQRNGWAGVVTLLVGMFLVLLGGTPQVSAEPDVAETKKATEQGEAAVKCICSASQAAAEQDIAELRKAAEQGNADAQRKLGLKHEKGNGVPQDNNQAVDWYRKAAEQGDAQAQWFLGGRYAEGKGVTQNDVDAYAWYSLAADQGNENAAAHKEITASKFTPEQRSQAQSLAVELKTKIDNKKQ